jgi:hypothetical protein
MSGPYDGQVFIHKKVGPGSSYLAEAHSLMHEMGSYGDDDTQQL